MGYNYEFVFSKKGDMVYISHLDLLRLFRRAARRAELPVLLTQGFHPHLRLNLKRALKLGVSSNNEEGMLALKENLEPDAIRNQWQIHLPQSIEILEVRREEKRNTDQL